MGHCTCEQRGIVMATKVTLLDDMDGSDNATTVEFTLNERTFEMELSPDNLAKLEAALIPFIEKARDTTPVPRWTNARHATVDQSLVRTWASENNVEVSPKGRVPGWIIDRYLASLAVPAEPTSKEEKPEDETAGENADDSTDEEDDSAPEATDDDKPKGRRGRTTALASA
jgi:Lsr2